MFYKILIIFSIITFNAQASLNQNTSNSLHDLETGNFSAAEVFITVICVNDQPSFESIENQFVQESNSYDINNWAYNIDFGADDENNTQSLLSFNVEITSDSNAILENVMLDNYGTLTFQTTANKSNSFFYYHYEFI